MKGKNVTIYDIAEKTGFSAVTVHRALNNKGRISEKTKQLILNTAAKMEYEVNPAAQGLRRTPIKIGAILYCPVDEYVDDIVEGILTTAESLKKYKVSFDVRKLFCTADSIKETEELLEKFLHNGYNGVILFLSCTDKDAKGLNRVIDAYSKKNIPIATVANNHFSSKSSLHVSIDAFTAGGMAAEILELSCKGKKVAFLGASDVTPITSEYKNGFVDYSKRSGFSQVVEYYHFDDKQKIAAVTKQCLLENPDLSGLYIATASSSLVCEYIKKSGRGDIAIVTTDLLADTPELLKNKVANATIFQNPYKQGKNVARYIYNYIVNGSDGGIHLISPLVLLSSNIDSYIYSKKDDGL